MENKLLESNEIFDNETSVKISEIVVHKINRTDLNKSLVCQASNNNIIAPSSTTVYLDVYCKYHILLQKYCGDPLL